MTNDAGYKNLMTWQVADELASKVYDLTAFFPNSEQFSLTSQLRRAALSVPTNIVEGYARNSKAEFRRFIAISLGSLAETKYLLEFAFRREYLKENYFNEAMRLADKCGQLLWKLYKSTSK